MADATYPLMHFPFHELTKQTIRDSIADSLGRPYKMCDLFWIDLSEDRVLDLDWYDYEDGGQYYLKICDNNFEKQFYKFNTRDPKVLFGEILRILGEYGWVCDSREQQ